MNSSKLLSHLKFFIGWPLSIISILFILKLIFDKGSALNFNINDINLFYLFSGVILFFGYFILRSFLWWYQLKLKGYQINFRENTYRFSFSELKRYTPGNIWSFLGRASQFKELGVDNKTVGISILADIQLVIIGCFLASIPAIFWVLNSPAELKNRLLSLIPISVVLISAYFLGTAWGYTKKYSDSKNYIKNIFLPGFELQDKFKLSAISTLTYFIFGLSNYLIFISLHPFSIQDFIPLTSFLVFTLLAGYLSFITPMGLGVREGLVTIGLSKTLSTIDAGFYAVFSRIVLVISELSFLLLVFIWARIIYKK